MKIGIPLIKIKAKLKKLKDFKVNTKEIFEDLMFLAGIMLFSYGLYQIYQPLMYCALGCFFIFIGIRGVK